MHGDNGLAFGSALLFWRLVMLYSHGLCIPRTTIISRLNHAAVTHPATGNQKAADPPLPSVVYEIFSSKSPSLLKSDSRYRDHSENKLAVAAVYHLTLLRYKAQTLIQVDIIRRGLCVTVCYCNKEIK